MQLSAAQFGLSKKKVICLSSFAAIWIGLQIAIVVAMLNCDFGTGSDAEYLYDCLHDVERLRVAIPSIIGFFLDLFVAVSLIFCISKKHRQAAIGYVVVGVALTVTLMAGSILSKIIIEMRLAKAGDTGIAKIFAGRR